MSLDTHLHVYWLFKLPILKCQFAIFAYFMNALCILIKSPLSDGCIAHVLSHSGMPFHILIGIF